jgi:rare lipoprotein A
MRQLIVLIIAFLITLGLNKLAAGEIGVASIYSVKTNGGTRTASGSRLNDNALTAAHKTLPLGSKVKVSCLKTGKSVVVKITDRGPFIKGRIIDLTPAAAKQIGLTWNQGLKRVSVTRVSSAPVIAKKPEPKKEVAILAKPMRNPNEEIKILPPEKKPFNWAIALLAAILVSSSLNTIMLVKLSKV